jgi:hypothetical protein
MNSLRIPVSILVFLLAFAATSLAEARHHQASGVLQQFQATGWVSVITNPYFPLIPGTTFHYEGTTDGVPTSDDVAVTHNTKVIIGVTCTEVHDQVFTDGVLSEDTLDRFAQDTDGNVWYFGEDTKELDPDGNIISTEGSWEAGVNGGQQGIIMEAHPRPGDKYQQEFLAGVAEDMGQVLNLNRTACVAYGCFDDLLLIKEISALEKGVTDHKYYAPGVGDILEDTVKGGQEHSELVSISTGH